jgi:hypothetical protein
MAQSVVDTRQISVLGNIAEVQEAATEWGYVYNFDCTCNLYLDSNH